MPKLSICILTNNNIDICKLTITGILTGDQDGYELLVVDASESCGALKQYVENLKDDRVRHISVAAENRQQHWNLAVPACQGEWITFVSDSDHIDPKIIQLIQKVETTFMDVDSIGWNKIDYDWPEHRNEFKATKISTKYDLFAVSKKKMQHRFFGYEKEGLVPFSIYHGVVKRDLVEKIYETYGKTYFEHSATSYEFGYKVLVEARNLAFFQRPMSLVSEQSEENLSDATCPNDIRYKEGSFYEGIEISKAISTFPFASNWSPKALAASALNFLANKYGDRFHIKGWETNFVKRREDECNSLRSLGQFNKLSTNYRQAIADWQDGRLINQFSPNFNQNSLSQKDLVGCFDDFLFLDKNALGSSCPSEFYHAYEHFAPPVERLGTRFVEKNKKAA